MVTSEGLLSKTVPNNAIKIADNLFDIPFNNRLNLVITFINMLNNCIKSFTPIFYRWNKIKDLEVLIR